MARSDRRPQPGVQAPSSRPPAVGRDRFDFRRPILALLGQRAPGTTICPSEVLAPDEKGDATLMEHVRRSARRLAAEGAIDILQRGARVDPQDFRGPIRLRLRRS